MITLTDNRERAVQVGLDILEPRLAQHGISREQFAMVLRAYEVKAIQDGECVIGMAMVRGPEVHVAVLPEYRGKWFSRRLCIEGLGPIIERHGYAKTDVMPDNAVGIDFCARLGFERHGNEWRLT